MSGPTEHEPTRTESTRTGLAESFDATAAAYELGRPEYPDAVLDWWDERGAFEPGHSVLDLAAGTGKLTRLLPIVCELHAVEPLANMRHEFAAAVLDVDVRSGTAEQIPYPDNTFDTVLVAQDPLVRPGCRTGRNCTRSEARRRAGPRVERRRWRRGALAGQRGRREAACGGIDDQH